MSRSQRTTPDETTSAEGLREAATAGREDAFAELFRRHAPALWPLATAIAGDADRAERALVEGSATVFTALRAGRVAADRDLLELLRTATRNAAIDEGVDAPVAGDDLAARFSELPEHWRAAIWLRLVDDVDAGGVGDVLGLDPAATSELLDRSIRGLAASVLAGVDAERGPTCPRACRRLGADLAGSLPDAEREHLERHLGLCEHCRSRAAALDGLPAALAATALPMPDGLHDRARTAWAAVVDHERGGFLSPMAEKVLAGVSAAAAAVGVLSFALLGGSDRSADADIAAAPLSGMIDRVASPAPFDLRSGIAIPAARSIPVHDAAIPIAVDPEIVAAHQNPSPPSTTTSDQQASATPAPGPTPAAESPAAPSSPVPVPEEIADAVPSATVGTELGDVPVAVEVGPEPGITVGPISLGSSPTPGDEPVVVDSGDDGGDDGSEEPDSTPLTPADGVADAVSDLLGG